MTEPDDIRQRLLEWRYGLLSEAEEADLRRELAENPQLAALAEDSARLSELFSRAAKPPITVKARPDAIREEILAANQVKGRRHLVISLCLAAMYLVFLVGGDWTLTTLKRSRDNAASELAMQQLKLSVEQTEPPSFQSSGKYAIQADVPKGLQAEVHLRYSVNAANGRFIFGSSGLANAAGLLEVVLPRDVRVPAGAKLHVNADCQIAGQLGAASANASVALTPTPYLTHVALDKTLYRPGETIRYRSLSLERFSLKADREFPIHFEIRDPSGAAIATSVREGVTQRGVGNGEFAIPPTQIGGEYSLVVKSAEGFFPEEIHKFHIQAYRVPRLRKELEFQQDSYGPGDTVIADFIASKAEGGAASGASLTITAEVDGQRVSQQEVKADESGAAHVEFKLPDEIRIGDGRLSVAIDDGGTRETLAKTIPIQIDRVEVTFYPASGDLVPTLDNRVYFVARNPQGKPVHIAGEVVDTRGRVVSKAETEHDGMGRFSFTVDPAEAYRLRLTKPEGLRASFDLPAPNANQVVAIDAGKGVFDMGTQPELTVSATRSMPSLLLTAYCRGVLVGQKSFMAEAGANAVKLDLPKEAGGVLRVTVHDASVKPPRPLAERLIFRQHGRQLNVAVGRLKNPAAMSSEMETELVSAPGERAKVDLVVTDETGKPVPAALGVAVVDDSVLVLADDKYPTLRTHFLVTSEVSSPEDIEDADFYLSQKPDAASALDLLLGTQGWRRFVEKHLVNLQQDPVLRAQVERLQSLGGVNVVPASVTASSPFGAPVAQQDVQYMRQVWFSASFLFGIVVLLDLLFVLLSRRRTQVLGMFLLIGSATVLGIAGCGRSGHEDAKTAAQRDVPAAAMSEATAATAPPAMAFANRNENPEEKAAPGDQAVPPLPFADVPKNAPDPNAGAMIPEQFVEHGADFLFNGDDAGAAKGLYRFHIPSMTAAQAEKYRFVVREYSYRQPQKRSDVRDDFTETLYWNPLLIADENGRASIQFDLSDSITTFRVTAHTHDNAGGLGTGSGEVMSRRPLYLEPKLPLEVTLGDRIDLPVAIVNGTSNVFDASLALTIDDFFITRETTRRSINVDANGRRREVFPLLVNRLGAGSVLLTGRSGGHSDAVKRVVNSVAQGFPVNESKSGIFSPGESQLSLNLPDKWQQGSLRVQFKAFPTPTADALQGLAGMLQEPHGCFEQTTSSNYPNTMVLRLLSSPQDKTPADTKLAAIRRAKDLLGRGYARLKGYESKSGGFEWFGSDPGHEALTAFGLMQFYDMAPVFSVDQAMLNRTTAWLMSRRDGTGMFNINSRYLHSWGAPREVVSAYILWGLTETRQSQVLLQLSNELAWAENAARSSQDPYLLALCAASLGNAERFDAADAILDRLGALAQSDGSFDGATTVTESRGDARRIETTALVTLAYQKRPAFAVKAMKLVEWLRTQRSGRGHFSSTQATVLALKTMLNVPTPVTQRGSQAPVVVLQQDGLELARLNLSDSPTPELDVPASVLKPGANPLTVMNLSGAPVAYSFDINLYTDKPASDDRSPLRLTTALSSTTAQAGQVVTLAATLKNTADRGQPMTVVSLGLPAGLEARTAQLDELKDKGVIDYYELTPRSVVCYWRTLEAKQQIDLKLDLTAEIPGHFTGPASKAWLYYTAEQKQWAAGLVVDISLN